MSINDKIIKLINKYQTNKSPNRIPRCVHYPSCSQYSKECFLKFNFFKASFLTIKRILFCTPLNKKFYDPVPLSKEEKKEEKYLGSLAEPIKEIILNHYLKYPKMQIVDFVKLIYQNTFGPHHLKSPNKEDIMKYLNNEIPLVTNSLESVEDIGNGYYRLYLGKNSDYEKISDLFYQETLINTNTTINIRVFYYKINILISLIKKKKIDLPKKEAINYLKDYLSNGVRPVSHSLIYNEIYKPHYRVLKRPNSN